MVNGCRRLSKVFLTSLGMYNAVLLEICRMLMNTSMISYPNYKLYWPIRALGLYAKTFGNESI